MTAFTELACWKCREPFCITTSAYQTLKRSGAQFHCPWGHAGVFSPDPTEADLLRRERDRLKQQAAQLHDEVAEAYRAKDAAERRASAARGQVTRLKNRAAAGVCPCCNRTFVNLARHMAGKHPGFMAEEIPEEATIQ